MTTLTEHAKQHLAHEAAHHEALAKFHRKLARLADDGEVADVHEHIANEHDAAAAHCEDCSDALDECSVKVQKAANAEAVLGEPVDGAGIPSDVLGLFK